MTTRTAGSATKFSRQCPPLRTATRLGGGSKTGPPPGAANKFPRPAPAAATRAPQPPAHRALHRLHHLVGGAHQAHEVGPAGESPAAPSHEVGVSRIVRSDGHRL